MWRAGVSWLDSRCLAGPSPVSLNCWFVTLAFVGLSPSTVGLSPSPLLVGCNSVAGKERGTDERGPLSFASTACWLCCVCYCAMGSAVVDVCMFSCFVPCHPLFGDPWLAASYHSPSAKWSGLPACFLCTDNSGNPEINSGWREVAPCSVSSHARECGTLPRSPASSPSSCCSSNTYVVSVPGIAYLAAPSISPLSLRRLGKPQLSPVKSFVRTIRRNKKAIRRPYQCRSPHQNPACRPDGAPTRCSPSTPSASPSRRR